MVEGRLRKFYEEVVLLKQAFVLNPDLTVEKALKEAEKDIGAPAKITGFVRFALGEGIDKDSHRLCGRSRGGGEKVTLDQPLLRRILRRAPRDIAAPFVYRAPNRSTGLIGPGSAAFRCGSLTSFTRIECRPSQSTAVSC